MIYEEWKKDIEDKIKKGFDKEKIATAVQRCPKCHNLSLEFDADAGRIHCTKCGFEEILPRLK